MDGHATHVSYLIYDTSWVKIWLRYEYQHQQVKLFNMPMTAHQPAPPPIRICKWCFITKYQIRIFQSHGNRYKTEKDAQHSRRRTLQNTTLVFAGILSILMQNRDRCKCFGILPDEQCSTGLPVNAIAGINKMHLAHSHLDLREWHHTKWAINCGVILGLPATHCLTSVDILKPSWILSNYHQVPLILTWITLIPAWIRNHTHRWCLGME